MGPSPAITKSASGKRSAASNNSCGCLNGRSDPTNKTRSLVLGVRWRTGSQNFAFQTVFRLEALLHCARITEQMIAAQNCLLPKANGFRRDSRLVAKVE